MDHQIITYCKGRLHHLKQSLPYMLCQAQVLVVIIGDEEARDWCLTQPVSVCWSEAELNQAHAKNCGLRWSKGSKLTFIDADRIIDYDPAASLLPGTYLHHCIKSFEYSNIKVGMAGNITIWKEDAIAIGGYNEILTNYGFDDTDFVIRLCLNGICPIITGRKFISIHHEDSLRTKFYHEKDHRRSWECNYIKSKEYIKTNGIVIHKEIGKESVLLQ